MVSSPTDIEFEIKILETALGLIDGMATKRFSTTYEQDMKILEDPNIFWRTYVAVVHRVTQKEILIEQERMMRILLTILKRIDKANEGTDKV